MKASRTSIKYTISNTSVSEKNSVLEVVGKNKEITSNGPPMLLKERCTEYFDQVAHNIET